MTVGGDSAVAAGDERIHVLVPLLAGHKGPHADLLQCIVAAR